MKIKTILKKLGPGFITGAADDDPSGIATYAQTGAQFGLNLSWTALFSFPFMMVMQEMCGRIGLVSGKGLSYLLKSYYPKWAHLLIFLLVIANLINIGADLGAMAYTLNSLVPIPFWIALCLFTVFILLAEIFITYKNYAKFLKFLAISLFAYVLTAFVITINWETVLLKTIQPSFSFKKEFLLNVVAILGTTISPYLFFWQESTEIEEIKGKQSSLQNLSDLKIDTAIGMFFSNLIMFFIIIVTAVTLNQNHIFHIETADQAAKALEPIAGKFAFLLFSLGIIGTGLLAIPILAGSAAYAVSELFQWHEGLNKLFKHARGFYSVIILATVGGALINFTSISPFAMLYYTAIFNGICAPPLMFFILKMANNKNIVGKHKNKFLSNLAGIFITIVMSVAVILLIWAMVFNNI